MKSTHPAAHLRIAGTADDRDANLVLQTPDEDEKNSRVIKEALRLASLTPGEYLLWIDGSAEQLGVPRATLEKLVLAALKDREKKERKAKAEARDIERRAEKKRTEREKALKAAARLPSDVAESKVGELAERFGESVDTTLTDMMALQPATPELWSVEPWHEPIETGAVLDEVASEIRKYIALHDAGVTAAALWTLQTWIHETAAIHSPILAAVSVEPESGKSTLLGVLRLLVGKPFVSVEPTGPSVYRTVDRHHPTLMIDEADDLFKRKSDLRAIVAAGWSRGTKIPRDGHWFDPFCPMAIGVLGKTRLPRQVASRSIILKMWPKKADEVVADFAYSDDDEFATIRRKLARWSADNAEAIKGLKPAPPAGFNNRLAANWELLLQIAEHAGAGWPERARQAAIRLAGICFVEPSLGVQALAAMRAIFANQTEVLSAEAVKILNADPDGPWHDYRGKGPISQNELAALLRNYEITPQLLHPTKRSNLSRRGYRRAQFEDMWARFLPPDPNM
jgi:hypothetical protein